MFFARKPFVRSTTLLAACAASIILLSSGIAQQRDSTLELAAVGQQPPSPVLNPRHPDSYVVQRGDTLWDIASMFLRDPWYWPEIWQINPQVENPHLIFPGDTLRLAYLDDGRPAINVERAPLVTDAGGGGFERLSPRVRSTPLDEAIQTIPYETIASFLSRPRFIDKREIDDMPYVVALREALIGSAGHDVYVRGLEEQAPVGSVFNVVELGGAFVDPETHDVLGYQGTYVGQGRLDRTGDPGTLRLLETEREALVGDLLADEEDDVPLNFIPRSPESEVHGQIIAVMSGVSLIGQYAIVVINRGSAAGLEPGHVLRAYQTGQTIRDSQRGLVGQKVRLPDEPAGTMMVFRTAERVSYALVMEATSPLAVYDRVSNP
jgi:LysM domain-containing protein